MVNTEILFSWTEDGLRLQGVSYPVESKDICILFVHGMAGNYIDNYFGHVLGEQLQKNNIGYIFTHNRGHSHINDIATKKKDENGFPKYERIGVTYERFEDSVYDIESWLKNARELGYKRFIIVGHSLGSPKIIHHFYKNKPKDVIGIILASPGDMVGLVKLEKYQSNYNELLKEAKRNVEEGNPSKMLSSKIWDWYELSSQTFLDLFVDNGPADILPILRNPDKFSELESLNIPILCVESEFDDIIIRTIEEDMELIKSKALNCPDFTTAIIPKANHTYENNELRFSEEILNWIGRIIKS